MSNYSHFHSCYVFESCLAASGSSHKFKVHAAIMFHQIKVVYIFDRAVFKMFLSDNGDRKRPFMYDQMDIQGVVMIYFLM